MYGTDDAIINPTDLMVSVGSDSVAREHRRGDETIEVHFDPDAHSSLRAILLVVALSLHSLFEGMALGLQDSTTDLIPIFVALLIHKSIIAFSLGLRLVQSRLKDATVVSCNLIFCAMAALGGVIGIALSVSVQAGPGNLINGLLQGIACGTFIYVTFFEVLPHELNPPGYRLVKLTVLLLGFLTVTVLMFYSK